MEIGVPLRLRGPAGFAIQPNDTILAGAEDGAAGDHFGYSVAISGDTIVVGAFVVLMVLNMNDTAVENTYTYSGELTLQENLTGVRVMVIDDSNTIRRSAEIFLMQAGCQVILAENGFDALAKISDHEPQIPDDTLQDLIAGSETRIQPLDGPARSGRRVGARNKLNAKRAAFGPPFSYCGTPAKIVSSS